MVKLALTIVILSVIGSTPSAGESLTDQLTDQLQTLAQQMEADAPLTGDTFAGILAGDFTCGPMRPGHLETIFKQGPWLVRRQAEGDPDAAAQKCAGAPAFATAITRLLAPLRQQGNVQVRFDIVRLEQSNDSIAATVVYHASAQGSGKVMEQSGHWQTRWRHRQGSLPLLERVEIVEFEELEARGPLFSDDTKKIIGHDPIWGAQFLLSVDDWLGRIESWIESDGFGHHGLAVGDVNGDGLDDLYVCDMGGLPNRLFVSQPDGTARDVSAEAGVDWLERTRSALLVDLDNDADQDLVLATSFALVFMSNDGTGHFKTERSLRFGNSGEVTPVTGKPQPVRVGGMGAEPEAGHFSRAGNLGSQTPSNIVMIASADYDNDGDLDIYACTYHTRDDKEESFPVPLPYHDANNGGRNILLENRGEWQFADATAQTGLDENNSRFSFAVSWDDYDNDGDQDLYVANDFGRNNLYRNDEGRFTDVAPVAGVEDIGAGMSVNWGDYDNDGNQDLYVGNMFSAAGQRLTTGDTFKDDASDETRLQYRKHARGNSLYRNSGEGTFTDVTEMAAVSMGRWAWNLRFIDIDNNGWADLVSVNGYFTRDNPDDLHDFFWEEIVARSPVVESTGMTDDYADSWRQLGKMIRKGHSLHGREPHSVFLNVGEGRFAFAPSASGLGFPDDGRAIAVTDWDHDGDLDLWLVNRTLPRLRFARNNLPGSSRWLAVRLEGRTGNRDAIGARVTLTLDDGSHRVKTLHAGAGYLSQSSKWIHFGLEASAGIDSIAVRWPAGSTEIFTGTRAGGHFRLTEGTGRAESWTPPAAAAPVPERSVVAPPQQGEARIVLSAPLPAPALPAGEYRGAPLLVTLWSPASETSRKQISHLVAQQAALEEANIQVIVLNTGSEGEARTFLKQTGMTFASGNAGSDYMKKLDLIMERVVAAPRPITLPTTLLIDGQELLSAIYKGPLKVDDLVADLPLLLSSGARRLTLAIPFPGIRQTRGMPPFFESMDAMARVYLDNGFPGEAVRYHEKVLRIQPGSVQRRFDLANALVAAGQLEKAIPLLRQALDLEPRNPSVMNNLAVALARTGDDNAAIALYRDLLSIEPSNAAVHINLGIALMRNGDPAEGLKHLAEATTIAPDNPEVHYQLGLALLRSGSAKKGRAALNKATQINPAHRRARYYLSLSLAGEGLLDEAMRQFAVTTGLPEGSVEAARRLAWALSTNTEAQLRSGTQAVLLAETACATQDHNPYCLDTLAAAYAEAGRYEDAVNAARRALNVVRNGGDMKLAAQIEERLSAYQAGRPYRDTR